MKSNDGCRKVDPVIKCVQLIQVSEYMYTTVCLYTTVCSLINKLTKYKFKVLVPAGSLKCKTWSVLLPVY